MRLNLMDDQLALSFLVQQASHIEAQVYQTQYPEIQYPALVPVDTSANAWAQSVTYFSTDKVGEADWFSGLAGDMRLADVSRNKYERGLEMAGIGYRYTLEELNYARLVPNTNLPIDRAAAARRAYMEFIDKLVWNGNTGKNWTGLLNDASVTRVDVANDGTSSSRLWTAKTGDQMVRDVNDLLTAVYTGSSSVELANTVLLPIAALATLANTRMSNTMNNALDYLMKYNLYTQLTGAPLTVRGVLGLEDAGTGSVGRIVVYRRDPTVLKLHLPMPHQFLPVWQSGPTRFDVPGIFRTGGLEIRRPGAIRYGDGITS